MLVLARKREETIVIDGKITIKVIHVRGNSVRLGIEAPDGVAIWRSELLAEPVDRSEPRLLPDCPAGGQLSFA
jgi:carbon storage regulator